MICSICENVFIQLELPLQRFLVVHVHNENSANNEILIITIIV